MKTKFAFFSVSIFAVLFLLITACKKDTSTTGNANTVKDNDGNVYHTVTIASRVWMVENLRTKHYRDGSEIANVTDNSAWQLLSTGAYCSYNNSTDNANAYGYLYNWYAVNDSRNICPSGWHIPTDAEWQTLVDSLGGATVAASQLKESGTAHWNSPNTDATNLSGFTALPGGNRLSSGGFGNLKSIGMFLSSTQISDSTASYRYMRATNSVVTQINNPKGFGASVRCIKD